MTTRSGKELGSLEELIAYYARQLDGLPVLLARGVTFWDPPAVAPVLRLAHLAGTPAAGALETADLSAVELAPGTISMIAQVGSGQFGQVYEAWLQPPQRAGLLVAVKTCKHGCSDKDRQDFLAEARTLLQFSHPVRLLAAAGVCCGCGGCWRGWWLAAVALTPWPRPLSPPFPCPIPNALCLAPFAPFALCRPQNVLQLLGVVTTVEPMQLVVEYMTFGDLRAVLKQCRSKGVAVHPAEQVFMAKQVRTRGSVGQ